MPSSRCCSHPFSGRMWRSATTFSASANRSSTTWSRRKPKDGYQYFDNFMDVAVPAAAVSLAVLVFNLF